ncbi:MAG: hypothetical protein ACJA0E_001060, partial [Bermanella sp.]
MSENDSNELEESIVPSINDSGDTAEE